MTTPNQIREKFQLLLQENKKLKQKLRIQNLTFFCCYNNGENHISCLVDFLFRERNKIEYELLINSFWVREYKS